MPRLDKFSAISTPMKPPPMTTADFGLFSSIKLQIVSASRILRSTKRFLASSMPSILGRKGFAPGDKIKIS